MKVRWVGCLIVLVLAAGCETGPRVNDVSFFELITDYMAGPPPDASNVMGLDDRKAYLVAQWSSPCWPSCDTELDRVLDPGEAETRLATERRLRELRDQLNAARREFSVQNRIVRASEQLQRERLREVQTRVLP